MYSCKKLYADNVKKLLLFLRRACAYGVEALVEKLVASGANVNSTNSFGFSCLLEASHRGFINIVKFLVRSPVPVNFSYIPLVWKWIWIWVYVSLQCYTWFVTACLSVRCIQESDAMNSPFSSAPCQSALAEASRCGFCKVVQVRVASHLWPSYGYLCSHMKTGRCVDSLGCWSTKELAQQLGLDCSTWGLLLQQDWDRQDFAIGGGGLELAHQVGSAAVSPCRPERDSKHAQRHGRIGCRAYFCRRCHRHGGRAYRAHHAGDYVQRPGTRYHLRTLS